MSASLLQCGAAEDVFKTHNYTKTPEESAAASLMAGMDVDCGSFLAKYLGKALAEGARGVKESDVDAALTHLFGMRIRLGLFDPPDYDPMGYRQLTPADINYTHHSLLSLQAARQGIVLFKNDARISKAATTAADAAPNAAPNAAPIAPETNATTATSLAAPTLPLDVNTIKTVAVRPRSIYLERPGSMYFSLSRCICH
jgi:beta-glucosidase-like glycosyl hydrolase